jgi:hypothetical protein
MPAAATSQRNALSARASRTLRRSLSIMAVVGDIA